MEGSLIERQSDGAGTGIWSRGDLLGAIISADGLVEEMLHQMDDLDLRCSFADNAALLCNLSEVHLLMSVKEYPGGLPEAVALTLPLLLYLIQLIRNLNCSSFEAGAMLKPAL